MIEKPYNFDLVNWILNQNFVYKNAGGTGNYTYGDIQRAIWDPDRRQSAPAPMVLATGTRPRVNQIGCRNRER